MNEDGYASDCGHFDVPVPGSISGGCRMWTGCHLCRACAHQMELFYVGMEDRYVAYLSQDRITTWPGGTLMKVISRASRRNAWCREPLVHVVAVDDMGARWYGDGVSDGHYIRLRRSRRRSS